MEPASPPSFPPSVQQWLADLAGEKRLAAKSLEAYRRDMAQFLAFLAAHKGEEASDDLLAGVQAGDIRGFLTKKRLGGTNPASLARAMSSLRSFYRHRARQGGAGWEAVRVISVPKKKRRLPRAASMEAMEDLLAGANKGEGAAWLLARDLALLALLYGAGLRLGEALALKAKAMDGDHGKILSVQGKGNKERQVPLLPLVRQLIGTYRRLCPFPRAPEDALFLSQRGRVLSSRQVQARLMALRQRLGLSEQITPHALRHAFASHLLREGGNLRMIQELLGHASLTTTQIYADLESEDLRRIHQQAHPRGAK